eukprot:jgi/Botrbrau1/10021/Bobra.0012s0108.1
MELTILCLQVTLGTNYWGSFYLTHLLLPRLKEAENSRVVFTTSLSEVHGDVDWSDLPGKSIKKSGYRPYARSKLWLIMLARELQRRLRKSAPGVDVFLAQPGIAKTDAFRKSDTETKLNAKFLSAFANVFGQNASRGAQSNLYVATAPELEGQGGAQAVYGPFYWGLPYVPFGLFAFTTNLFNTSLQPPVNALAYDAVSCKRDGFARTLGNILVATPANMAARCTAFQGAWLLLLCLSALTVAVMGADQDSTAPAIMYNKPVQTGNSQASDVGVTSSAKQQDVTICKCQNGGNTDFGATGACCLADAPAPACQIFPDCNGCLNAFLSCCKDRGLDGGCVL